MTTSTLSYFTLTYCRIEKEKMNTLLQQAFSGLTVSSSLPDIAPTQQLTLCLERLTSAGAKLYLCYKSDAKFPTDSKNEAAKLFDSRLNVDYILDFMFGSNLLLTCLSCHDNKPVTTDVIQPVYT